MSKADLGVAKNYLYGQVVGRVKRLGVQLYSGRWAHFSEMSS